MGYFFLLLNFLLLIEKHEPRIKKIRKCLIYTNIKFIVKYTHAAITYFWSYILECYLFYSSPRKYQKNRKNIKSIFQKMYMFISHLSLNHGFLWAVKKKLRKNRLRNLQSRSEAWIWSSVCYLSVMLNNTDSWGICKVCYVCQWGCGFSLDRRMVIVWGTWVLRAELYSPKEICWSSNTQYFIGDPIRKWG